MSEEIEGNVIYIPVEVRASTKKVVDELSKQVNDTHKKMNEILSVSAKASPGESSLTEEPSEETKEAQTPEGEDFIDKLVGTTTAQQKTVTPEEEPSEEDKAVNDVLKNAIGDDINDAIETNTKSGGKLSLTSILKSAGISNAEDVVSSFTNPLGILKTAAMGVPIVGGVIAVGETAISAGQDLFNMLTARGMPFDLHFKRQINQEQDELISRQQQQSIHLGQDQIIRVNSPGQKFNPAYTVNTLQQVRNQTIFHQSQWQIRKGYNF